MDDAEFDREALAELINKIPEETFKDPITVPLVVYIGDERHVIGEAVVVGNKIISYVEKENNELIKRLTSGELKYMSFSTEPAELIPTIEHGLVPPVTVKSFKIKDPDKPDPIDVAGLESLETRYPIHKGSALPLDFEEKLGNWDPAQAGELELGEDN